MTARLTMAIAWVILSPAHSLRRTDPGPPGWQVFQYCSWRLRPPQALFCMNTEIKRDKGRAIKEAQHEVFKPQQSFPDHMIED
ncbi:MAG: hypothetical protein C7B46_11320 [Sulfobacillus benefaciens]|uniref:Uncharacterized protein n=1 Tax=Sulfobacillus benefaciens TaxID=453960 RepID=A0A2T2XF60_9FIRM|nr:MAG: hypothetical protein C7B46_11320 [Sulfobacillus benefaciens]